MTLPDRARPWTGVAALAVVVVLTGFPQLTRAGYSPDEEFTVFAVNGIEADGLPILPSGLCTIAASPTRTQAGWRVLYPGRSYPRIAQPA